MISIIDYEPYTSEQLAYINDTIRVNICKLKGNVKVNGVIGQLVFTRNAIDTLGENIGVLLSAVATFNQFKEDNDPYSEHDFGIIELFGKTWFWKFDYYEKSIRSFGHDVHLLTIMEASDY